MEETGENHQPVASHFYHIMVPTIKIQMICILVHMLFTNCSATVSHFVQKGFIPQQRYIVLFIYPEVTSECCRKEEVIRERRRKHVHQKQMYTIHVLIIYTFKIATVMHNYLIRIHKPGVILVRDTSHM
jgi:hypothetical protein